MNDEAAFCRLTHSFFAPASSTPTAAPAAGQPKIISSLRVLPSLTLPAPYSVEHTAVQVEHGELAKRLESGLLVQ